jgi:hypothetical protein
MKLILFILVSLSLAASEPQQKKATTPTPVKKLEIPAGAVEQEPGRYSYTDADGKKWLYTKTPFGVMRLEAKDGDVKLSGEKADDVFVNTKITVEGDVVKFERPGPFGIYKWQKKLKELDDREAAAVRRSQGSSVRQDK